MFLDVSKAFDKVWIDGLLFKIQQLGIVGKRFDWIKAYISGRHQKVVLNGFQSNIRLVTAGIPQGSILDLYCSLFTLTTSLRIRNVL